MRWCAFGARRVPVRGLAFAQPRPAEQGRAHAVPRGRSGLPGAEKARELQCAWPKRTGPRRPAPTQSPLCARIRFIPAVELRIILTAPPRSLARGRRMRLKTDGTSIVQGVPFGQWTTKYMRNLPFFLRIFCVCTKIRENARKSGAALGLRRGGAHEKPCSFDEISHFLRGVHTMEI